jgi:hypothetical protein
VSVVKEEESVKYETDLENKTDENGNYKIDNNNMYRGGKGKPLVINRNNPNGWTSPLPVSVVKEPEPEPEIMNSELYGELPTTDSYATSVGINKADKHKVHYDPPLPVSVVKEEGCYGEKVSNSEAKYGQKCARQYDPPLPVSVVKDETKYISNDNMYRGGKGKPLEQNDYSSKGRKNGETAYDPPLPTTMLEVKSTRGKHSTEKPVALMEWILKYYSKEGDVVLDPTMGSGSTGVACKNMNRNFIGIEMDDEIYEVAVNRIED